MFTALSRVGGRHCNGGLQVLQASNCQPKGAVLPSSAIIRHASQLYPTTSRRWDDAMLKAESIVGDSSNFSSLQQWVSGEFNNITKYLQRLVGTNHPMLETAKRCTYISEGRMGSAQARGLTVMLTSKALGELTKHSCRDKDIEAVIKNQLSLAEMTEMTYSAYMIHRGVMDLKMYGLESVDQSIKLSKDQLDPDHLDPEQAKALHYGNKVSVLCGDFLLAYVMRGLGDLFSSKVVDLVASSITEFMEGEFLLIDDWRSKNYLLSKESRDLKRWIRRSHATIGSLQGNTCQASLVLANINGKLQYDARELGRNLGLAWQAHTELQPFLRDTYEPIELPEMPPYPAYDLNCLPVLLFLRQSHDKNKNFRLMMNEIKTVDSGINSTNNNQSSSSFMNQHRHQEPVNYERLHQLVLNQSSAIDETVKIIQSYSGRAIKHLDSFPPSEAKEVLVNICESLYRK
uniref:Decaprenyl-diphosphate synthase subunit 2 n=1 Tax=Aceria tosichella TaxID=561515 RepID=A0A6G1SK55_9ACAR